MNRASILASKTQRIDHWQDGGHRLDEMISSVEHSLGHAVKH